MYEFNAAKHIHTFDGKPLCGVTTVLSVISKPALIQWSADEAVKSLGWFNEKYADDKELALTAFEQRWNEIKGLERDEAFKLLSDARSAHRKKKEKAGDWGTAVHKAIEEWIKGNEPVLTDETQKLVFGKFKDWVKENKIEFLENEKHVWSEKLWLGGILDLVFTMDGKKYIGDIKTSSGIYNEAFFQMGAYDLCLEDMGEHKDIEGYIVINLKKDGTIDFKRADNMELNKEAFKSALSLYKIIKSME